MHQDEAAVVDVEDAVVVVGVGRMALRSRQKILTRSWKTIMLVQMLCKPNTVVHFQELQEHLL